MLTRSAIVSLLLSIGLPCLAQDSPSPAGAAAPAGPAADEESTYEFFLASANRYRATLGADKKPLKLMPRPILNWSNPERKTPAGAVFLWTDDGRPAIAMCIYPNVGNFDHEFQSLAETGLEVGDGNAVVWKPDAAGLQFRPLPMDEGAAVGATRLLRLRQMRNIARGFSGLVGNQNRQKALRLLPSPLFRYPESSQRTAVDGALFSLVQGTDPEVLLLIEAVPGTDEALRWRYALARMTMVPLKVSHKNVTLLELGWASIHDPAGPYYTRSVPAEPETAP